MCRLMLISSESWATQAIYSFILLICSQNFLMRKHQHFLLDISIKLEDLKILKYFCSRSFNSPFNSKTNPYRFKQLNTFSIYGVELVIFTSHYSKASLFKQEKRITFRFQLSRLNLNQIRTCSYHFTAIYSINLKVSIKMKICLKFLISSHYQCLTSLSLCLTISSKTTSFKERLKENNNLIDITSCLNENELTDYLDNEFQNKSKIFQLLIWIRWEIYFHEKCRNNLFLSNKLCKLIKSWRKYQKRIF